MLLRDRQRRHGAADRRLCFSGITRFIHALQVVARAEEKGGPPGSFAALARHAQRQALR